MTILLKSSRRTQRQGRVKACARCAAAGGPKGVGGPTGAPNALGPRSRAYVNNALKVYLPQRAAR